MNVLAVGGLILLLALCILLDAAYQALPLKELRRRARSGQNKKEAAIYKVSSYGATLKIFLWTVGVTCATALIVWVPRRSWWLSVIVTLLIIWAVVIVKPVLSSSGVAIRIAAFFAPAVSWLLEYLHPLLGRFGGSVRETHTGIFEREDLVELLRRQSGQVDSRISQTELKAVRGALSFGDIAVGSVMTPRKAVTWVDEDDAIGPKLMDDLHKTGHIRFPVIAGSSKPVNPEVVGILYLRDLLINLEKPGKVANIMKRDAHFINESHTLLQALDGFLKSGQHLLVVVNNFEEVVGVLTLEDVLSQILGEKVSDEFDSYDNRHTVAGHQPKEHSRRSN